MTSKIRRYLHITNTLTEIVSFEWKFLHHEPDNTIKSLLEVPPVHLSTARKECSQVVRVQDLESKGCGFMSCSQLELSLSRQ